MAYPDEAVCTGSRPGGRAVAAHASSTLARMSTDAEQAGEGPEPPRPCGPCRGTGHLRSGLGGTDHEVTCPWCEGGGRFIPGHDAQAAAGAAETR